MCARENGMRAVYVWKKYHVCVGFAYESGNFAKIVHLLWKWRYCNKIIGCKYKRTSCNEDICRCRMRANVLANTSYSEH